jgi:hypothetical protein
MDDPLGNSANSSTNDGDDTPAEFRPDGQTGDRHEDGFENRLQESQASASEQPQGDLPAFLSEPSQKLIPQFSSASPGWEVPPYTESLEDEIAAPQGIEVPSFAYVGRETPRQRNLRNNLFTLLGLSLASFVLTAWVLVRVESPFGLFGSGPRDVVSAQLRALDRGEMRVSYNMFSEQYRKQVTFDQWRELVVTHWRLFHAEILGAEPPEQAGQRVVMEIHLRGADEKPYLARFTLIRAQGRWWIDDLHWANEPDERDLEKT